MKSKIFKPALFVLCALLTINSVGFAQGAKPKAKKSTDTTGFDNKSFPLNMESFGNDLQFNMKDLGKDLSTNMKDFALQFKNFAPQINLQFKDFDKNFDLNFGENFNMGNLIPEFNLDMKGLGDNLVFNFNDDDKALKKNVQSGEVKEKIKNYSKSYPIDGNDKIKLNNQFGKITVNTWDKHEVKVDVEIKADAYDDSEAQKLLDNVHITDGKSGDEVSFKTEIDHGNSSIWAHGRQVHKIEINYTVYMPAKTDLDVTNSYGSTILPDLQGKLKIHTSYGGLVAQNLSNPLNEINGGYGSLQVGSMNGGHLAFSYGSVEIKECNNIKAELGYGSFRLGSLKGNGDFKLEFVSGFKINEITSSLKTLNINASYSVMSLGVSGNNGFDFDITTSYGGFNYPEGNVTITDKTPTDGRHFGLVKTYKGHFGKGSNDAQINIHSSYGSVNFK